MTAVQRINALGEEEGLKAKPRTAAPLDPAAAAAAAATFLPLTRPGHQHKQRRIATRLLGNQEHCDG
jgi:hypothetical protein